MSFPIEPIYVADTMALIYYLRKSSNLSSTANAIFRAAEEDRTEIAISAISVAELYYANQKNRWFDSFEAVYQEIKSKPYFRLMPIEVEHILQFDEDVAVPEMHDRLIVGLARRLNAPLITTDPLIKSAQRVRVVW